MNAPIYTERTLLRPYRPEDEDRFVALFLDEEVNRFMGGPCGTREEAMALFRKAFEVYNGLFGDRHFEIWAIELDGYVIGHFELKQSNDTDGDELEVVYLLDQAYWGRGLLPEVLAAVNGYATGLGKRVIATVYPDNARTLRALEKTGIAGIAQLEGDEKVLKIWLKPVVREF